MFSLSYFSAGNLGNTEDLKQAANDLQSAVGNLNSLRTYWMGFATYAGSLTNAKMNGQ